MATKQAIQQEALTRASTGQSFSNYTAIFEGFMRKGIPEDAIKPRENVFTYNAWRALGRQVKKGEHGVRCLTFIDCEREDKSTGEKQHSRRPWHTTVFHVSQTEQIGAEAPALDATEENVPFAGEDAPEDLAGQIASIIEQGPASE
jgi:antirestriction protein ArdC